MPSLWIEHVKMIQAKDGISYKDALKTASKSYKAMHSDQLESLSKKSKQKILISTPIKKLHKSKTSNELDIDPTLIKKLHKSKTSNELDKLSVKPTSDLYDDEKIKLRKYKKM